MSEYGHHPFDEDGITYDDPWLYDLTEEEIKDRWRQGTGTDLTPR